MSRWRWWDVLRTDCLAVHRKILAAPPSPEKDHALALLNAVLLGIPSIPIERSDETAAQQGTVDPGATPATPPRP